ncbi:MAG: GNAT family N-acetyltransferase [Chloroflexota bacterium]
MSSNPITNRKTIVVNGVEIPDCSVHMVRPSLLDLASDSESAGWTSQFPNGYQIRAYQPGDEVSWYHIQREAEPFFCVAEDLFQNQFGDHLELLPGRMFFVEALDSNGESTTVGTATAWWKDAWKESGPWGQVHWVAIVPSHQGKGLAKPLMNQVMRRIALSHDRAMLGTSTGRVWAIKVYLDYGFFPDKDELKESKVRYSWQQIQQILCHPILEESLTLD